MADEASEVGMSAATVPAIFGMRFICLALIQNRILAKMEILLNIFDENRIKIKKKNIPLLVQIHSSTPRNTALDTIAI